MGSYNLLFRKMGNHITIIKRFIKILLGLVIKIDNEKMASLASLSIYNWREWICLHGDICSKSQNACSEVFFFGWGSGEFQVFLGDKGSTIVV